MHKVVNDTNVIVSSLIQKSLPYLIVYHLVVERSIRVCLSNDLIKEYREVLAREKFKKYPVFFIKAEALLTDIEALAEIYFPNQKLAIIDDEPDNRVLELASESKADFIITGNTKDFTFPVYDQTKIVTPKEYWDVYKSQK